MNFVFTAQLVEWRGPAPFVFAPLPQDIADIIREHSGKLSYGWGCIAVKGRIGQTTFTTSLMPRQGTYFLPIKVFVQRSEQLEVGTVCECNVWVELQPLH